MKAAIILFLLVFYFLTLLPGIQFLLTPFPKERLDGLYIKRTLPELSLEAVLNGKYKNGL